MDGSPIVQVERESDEFLTGIVSSNPARLLILCRHSTTELAVITGMSPQPESGIDDEVTVRVRFDEGKPATQVWSEGTDHESLFAPEPIALSKRLTKARRLYFEFTPFERSAETVSFDLRGLDEKLSEVSSTCHWN